jgi:hypothetical protein
VVKLELGRRRETFTDFLKHASPALLRPHMFGVWWIKVVDKRKISACYLSRFSQVNGAVSSVVERLVYTQ